MPLSNLQFDMFPAEPETGPSEPVVVRADPGRIRGRLAGMLAELRTALPSTANPRDLRFFEKIVPQMSRWLPADEAARVREDFAAEFARLA